MVWNDGGWGAGGWVLMSLLMVAFWVTVVIGIVWLIRWMRAPSGPEGDRATQLGPPAASWPPDEARRILDERYARGEISEEEYLRRRDVLAGAHAPRSV